MLWRIQITEEGNHGDRDEEDGGDVTQKTFQLTEDINSDTPTSVKDVLLQPRTTDDGYLTPTTRTTADSADVLYLKVLDSPTDATGSFDMTATRKCISVTVFWLLRHYT